MGERVELPAIGRELRDCLFERGVEFRCGGMSGCGACKVRVLEGDVPVTPAMAAVLSEEELAGGWRLACEAEARTAVALEIEQWSAPVLSDEARVEYEERAGFGAVVDVGTTTVVVQVVDLATGEIVGVETAWNAQARDGADIMTRLGVGLREPGRLAAVIRQQLEAMLERAAAGRKVAEALLVGNTAMHHLCGELDVEPLCAAPFRPAQLGPYEFSLGGARAVFLGCAGGFAGSDLLAGVIATGMAEAAAPQALLDLGTNGEIAFGDRNGIQVASTAAGPAFEAGKIKQGMRASAGAVDQVRVVDGRLESRVIGGGMARGICGSGIVDATAAALDLRWLTPRGKVTHASGGIPLTDAVGLTQRDVRELQLAKAAVASGYRLLSAGIAPERVFLAGAFGNYVRAISAKRIGLLPDDGGATEAAGNTALRGARMLLLEPKKREERMRRLTLIVRHVELAALGGFQECFVDEMVFPG